MPLAPSPRQPVSSVPGRLSTGQVYLNGGTLKYNAAPGSTANVGTVVLGTSQQGYLNFGAASSGTSVVTIGTIQRGAGAALGAVLTSATGSLGRFTVSSTLTTIDGIVPWAVETSTPGFLTGSAVSGTTFLGAYGSLSGTYQTGTPSVWGAFDNVKLTSGSTSLSTSGSAPVANSISLILSSSATLDLAGKTLALTAGGILAANNYNATIQDGSLTASGSTTELILNAYGSPSNPVTVNAAIVDGSSGSVSVVKSGSGALVLNGTNMFTGALSVAGGVLTIGTTGAISAASNLLVGAGASVTLNGTANGSAFVNLSTGNNTPNFTLTSGAVLGGTLTLTPPVSGPVSVYGNNAISGYATAGGGSKIGGVVASGRLDLTGSTPIVLGTISGSGSTGWISNFNTAAGGVAFNFANGSSISMFNANNGSNSILNSTGSVWFTQFGYAGYTANPTVTTVAGSAVIAVSSASNIVPGQTVYGYQAAPGCTVVSVSGTQVTLSQPAIATGSGVSGGFLVPPVVQFESGTFDLGYIGQNNTSTAFTGTATISNGANVVVSSIQSGFVHGGWHVTSGTLTFLGNVSQSNTGYIPSAYTVDNSAVPPAC